MTNTRKFFTLTKKEIDCAFKSAQTKKYFNGIKMLVSPSSCLLDDSVGKLLIIIPRTSGKAHNRNLFRRRLKAIFYTEKLFTQHHVWILMAQKRALSLDFDTLKKFLVSTISGI